MRKLKEYVVTFTVVNDGVSSPETYIVAAMNTATAQKKALKSIKKNTVFSDVKVELRRVPVAPDVKVEISEKV